MKKSLVITIDGPAGSGKSTVANILADRLGFAFLDTGAMYRAVTVAAMQAGIELADEAQLLKVLADRDFVFSFQQRVMKVTIDGIDVTERIRLPEVTANVRYIASAPQVRKRLVRMQRELAQTAGRIVTEGRDQGTVAFPDAAVKFFLTADIEERASRRHAELAVKASACDIEEIRKAIEERDISDRNRSAGPLIPAPDAVVVDTTKLNVEQVVEKLLHLLKKKTRGKWVDRIIYRFVQRSLKILCIVLLRMRVFGLSNVPQKGSVLLLCNHQSYLDPIFCGAPINRVLTYVARATLTKNRLYTFLTAKVDMIHIKRYKADITAMKTIIARLKNGCGVVLFPEATRSRDGRISNIKPGFSLLSRRSKAPVVPVVIDGAYECWPRNRKFPSPAKVYVCYGQPISPEEIDRLSDKEFAKMITDTLRQMQYELRIKAGRTPYDYSAEEAV
ncbi:MAG: (d)CMP kinase [Planctomycetota bacterium]